MINSQNSPRTWLGRSHSLHRLYRKYGSRLVLLLLPLLDRYRLPSIEGMRKHPGPTVNVAFRSPAVRSVTKNSVDKGYQSLREKDLSNSRVADARSERNSRYMRATVLESFYSGHIWMPNLQCAPLSKHAMTVEDRLVAH